MLRQQEKLSQQGFTIVELLIVIVVIAILAAISIVSYNGIQQRARNTQVTAGVNQYLKAIQSYYVINSAYPTDSGCLGSNYPNDQCWLTNGSASRVVNSALDSRLSEFIPSKPTLATRLLNMGPGYSQYDRAGLAYIYTSPANIELRYYLEGLNLGCISGFTSANEGQLLTRCIMTLAN
jgi:prepilin-type N-terminal cleavage/methylation domain-containing protein